MSEDTARLVDQEVARIVNEAYDRAAKILREKKELLDRLSKLLMIREVMEGDEIKGYVDGDRSIPSVEEEQARLKAERTERERKAEEAREKRERREREEAAATEQIPPAPHAAERTEELEPRSS
jgi:cell division protease FtsH